MQTCAKNPSPSTSIEVKALTQQCLRQDSFNEMRSRGELITITGETATETQVQLGILSIACCDFVRTQ